MANLWAVLKDKLRARTISTVRGDVEQMVKSIWNEDPGIKFACEKLGDSMPARIREVIDNNGGATHY